MLFMYAAMIDDKTEQLCFEHIYNNYRKQMLLVAERILHQPEDAEDAVQIALLRIAQRIKSIPTGNSQVLRAYVLTCAKNAALSMLPKKQRQDSMINISELPLSSSDDLFEQVMASQDYDLLLRAMRKLEPPYREVLMLVYVEEQSVKHAAAILRRREGTVRQQLNRGKKLLVTLCRKEGMCFEQEHINAI